MSRLDDLRELAAALKPTVLDIQSRSEHGLQGASGLIGQYRATLAEIEELEKALPAGEGTGLDEFTRRLSERQQTPGKAVASKRRQPR